MKFSTFCDLVKKYPNERVQIFIDGANFYKALEKECATHRLDYGKFATRVVAGRKLVRINYYISTLNAGKEAEAARNQQKFLRALQATPFVTIKTRPLHYKAAEKGKGEKGIDILLASDMLSQAHVNGYDTAILVSGDGDFAPVLDEIKKMGKRVENACFKSSRSDALVTVADVFIELDKNTVADCFL